jgi:hypothetical protein
MRPSSLLSLATWCSLASFGVAEGLTRCATEASESFRALSAEVAEEEARGAFDSIEKTLEIDTYFHVVAFNNSHNVEEGYVSVRGPRFSFFGVMN